MKKAETLKTLLESDFSGMGTFIEQVMKKMFPRNLYHENEHDCFNDSQDINRRARNLGIVGITDWGYAQLVNRAHLYEVILGKDTQGKEADLRRQRQNLRHFIRVWMKTEQWRSAFVIFRYAETKGRTWRFSYISRKGDEFSNLRRFTYLFRQGQSARTAIEQFEVLFEKATKQALLPSHVEYAFSVETVSKSFFEGSGLGKEDKTKAFTFWEKKYSQAKTRDQFGYVQWYLLFTSYVIANKNNPGAFGEYFKGCDDKIIRDYVKKLFGRIVFLFFLQKKGWMGCPANTDKWEGGNQRFMQELFEKASDAQKDNFLDGVLEPLFFECLNKKRFKDIYHTNIEKIGKVRIPYLNGGLFEKGKIDPPKSVFPANYFKYLFEFFDRYNFTIDENDPDDSEVSVDPEMLGRIFENLLEDNKDKGAYYTPKEIVSYMCKESLIAYLNRDHQYHEAALRHFVENHDLEGDATELDTAECKEALLQKLYDVRICDPAIGSGAFPMGLLLELKKCREALGEENTSKSDIIQNNIYGVDIEAGAVDIARLRFWLSLIVDADAPTPLPNLNYKIMQGNSLLESYKRVDLSNITNAHTPIADKQATVTETASSKAVSQPHQTEMFGHTSKQLDLSLDQKQSYLFLGNKCDKRPDVQLHTHNLQMAMRQYFSATDHTVREGLRDQINLSLSVLLTMANINIEGIDPSANDKFCLWHTWFKDVFDQGGFDIVIGNPPYLRVQEIERTQGEVREQYEELYPNSTGGGAYDLAFIFFERAIQISKEHGICSYILPHKYLNSSGCTTFRDWLMEGKYVQKIAHFGANQVFKNANTYTCITMFSKSPADKISLYKAAFQSDYLGEMVDQFNYHDLTYEMLQNGSKLYGKNNWIMFDSEKTYKIFTKIHSPKRLKNILSDIYQGIATSKDDLYFLNKNSDGSYTVPLTGKSYFLEDRFIKPVLKGDDVQRWSALKSERYVFFPYKLHNDTAEFVTLDELKGKYPNTYQYVIDNESVFRGRESGKAGTMHISGTSTPRWYDYIYPKNLTKYEQPKLTSMEICANHPNVTLNKSNYYHNTKAYSWLKRSDSSESYEYILALANSPVLWWYLKLTGDTLNGDARTFKTDYLNPFPLPEVVSEADENEIKRLVNEILEAKRLDDQADVSPIEKQLYGIIYRLYHLTDEEIKIIEKEMK